MASTAPITVAPTDELNFKLNGTTPFANQSAYNYIAAAHAVACIAPVGPLEGRGFGTNNMIVARNFDAIALLLEHAARLAAEFD